MASAHLALPSLPPPSPFTSRPAAPPSTPPTASLLALAASFSCEPILPWLAFWLQRLGLPPHCDLAPYGTLEWELRQPRVFQRRAVCVGLLRFSDWQRGVARLDALRFDADLCLFEQSLRAALQQLPRLVLVLCPARPSPDAGVHAAAAARLHALASEIPRLAVVDGAEASGWYGISEPHDVLGDELGHLPYTEPMWCALAAAAARAALPALCAPLKLVVLDCDYTLWHGAVGEAGVAGVCCEPRHRELHERVLALAARGVLLALCSRNVPEDVWAVLERTDDQAPMLRREHISATRIAPQLNKGGAVAELCAELRCAPESALFIDDNPSECAMVRSVLPATPVWCYPPSHAEAKTQLTHVWRLDLFGAASKGGHADARLRKESLAAEPLRMQLRNESSSLAEYLEQLRVKIRVEQVPPAPDGEQSTTHSSIAERLQELHARTNQFNAWKRPLAPPLALTLAYTAAVHVCDRYADYGLVGASIAVRRSNALRVASFCMSCRVLGRGVEHALLAAIGLMAREMAPPCAWVDVGVVDNVRNAPVRCFLSTVAARISGAQEIPAAAAEGGVDGVGVASALLTSWADERPSRWIRFPAELLAEVRFDPRNSENEAMAAMEAHGVAEGTAAATAASEEEERRRNQSAAALSLFPTELRTAEQAMRQAGRDHVPLPRLPRRGYSEHDVKLVLRAVWNHVLRLQPSDSELLDDSTPFGSLGGDSTLAVSLTSLAARQGLDLRGVSLPVESMSIDRIAHEVMRAERTESSHGEAAEGLAASRRLHIIERDIRDPKAPLRDVGGIGACAAGELDAAREVVASGWSAAYAADKHGNTALMWAAGGGHLSVVRWLLEELGVAVDAVNKDGRTALQWACKAGQVEVVAYLLDAAGADPSLRMKDDSTAFDWAVLSGHLPTMELVAAHPRVDIHALNKWAAAAGNVSTLRWLMSRGVPLGHVNAARHGAIVKAAWKGHRDALRWLLFDEEGPRLTDQLSLRDLEGRTVAQLVRLNGQNDVADWLQHLIEEREGDSTRARAEDLPNGSSRTPTLPHDGHV